MNRQATLGALLTVGLAIPAGAQEVDRFGMVGITAGQTAQLNVVNTVSDADQFPCRVRLSFFDSEGNVIPNPNESTLAPGKAVSLAVINPDVRPGERFQLRALVRKFDDPATRNNDCRGIRSTVEVFDSDGKTTVFISNPDN